MAQKTIKTEKKCHKCKVVKPMEMFYQNKNRSDGHNSACSDCAKAIAAQWRIDNLEKSIENGKKWRKEHPDRMASSSRKQKLKFKYGMTPDDYTNMAQQQGQCCAICGNHMDLLPKGLVVDHDHETGKVRGLLCNSCNSLLGYAKDSIDNLNSAIRYLINHKGQL